MNKQQGSAHVAVVIVLVVALLGALGFIFWQNFIKKDDTTKQNATTSAEKKEETVEEVDSDELSVDELGLTLSSANAIWNDIEYQMTSVNSDDTNKYVAAIYSKDLNARVVADAEKTSTGIDYTDPYWRLSGNRAVYAYYYDPPTNSMNPEMIDGVASNIINPRDKSAQSKLYVGFMGPGSYSTINLHNESMNFKQFVTENLK